MVTKGKGSKKKQQDVEAEAEAPLEDETIGATDKGRIGKDPAKMPGGYAGGKASAARPAKDRQASSRKAAATRHRNQVSGPQDYGQEERGSNWQVEKEGGATAEAMQEQMEVADEEGEELARRVEKRDADFNPEEPEEEEEVGEEEEEEADVMTAQQREVLEAADEEEAEEEVEEEEEEEGEEEFGGEEEEEQIEEAEARQAVKKGGAAAKSGPAAAVKRKTKGAREAGRPKRVAAA